MKRATLGFFIIFGTLSSFASEQSYELLKEAYLNADSPAQINFFDSVKNETKRCVSVKKYQGSQLSETIILKGIYHEGSEPDNGPMFPGTVGQKVETIYFSDQDLRMTDMKKFITYFTTESLSSDLKVTMKRGSNNEILLLRNGVDGLVFFRWDGINPAGQGPFSEMAYGYCYPIKL